MRRFLARQTGFCGFGRALIPGVASSVASEISKIERHDCKALISVIIQQCYTQVW